MRQNQSDGLRMLRVEQFAQLLRIGALQLRQIALRGLLRAADQHQQLVGALLAEGLDEQAAGVVQSSMHHEALRLEQLPELLQDFGRHARGDAAQIGQLLRSAAVHPPRATHAESPSAISSPTATSRTAALRTPDRFAVWRFPARYRFPAAQSIAWVLFPALPFLSGACQSSALFGVNPALQQARALRRLPLQVPRHLLEDLLCPYPFRVRFGGLRSRQRRAVAAAAALPLAFLGLGYLPTRPRADCGMS